MIIDNIIMIKRPRSVVLSTKVVTCLTALYKEKYTTKLYTYTFVKKGFF